MQSCNCNKVFCKNDKLINMNFNITKNKTMSTAKKVVYRKNVSEPWFSLIKIGAKTVEGRLNKGEFASMRPGDKIIFSNDQLPFPRQFTVQITGIKKYANFKEYLQKETLPSCLPGIKKLEEGLAIYHMYYTPEDAERFGIVAIKMRI